MSYALGDIGDLARAEAVVQRAIDRAKDVDDPYTRVRLYWSMARLAQVEGRTTVALANVRKAIALLQLTDDTLHLARANILAASIALSRGDADTAEPHLDHAESLLGNAGAVEDVSELKYRRSRLAMLRGNAADAIRLAREAIELIGGKNPIDEGVAFGALADGLALGGETQGADEAYRRSVGLLEEQGRWRDASLACRSWAHMLRSVGREDQAMDVLERAADLATRALPADARVER
jgi:tetratricopeptide (TPR) repeat protein